MTERRAAYHTASTLEAELSLHLRATGIPAPLTEYKFHPKRKFRADFAWPEFMLLVEVEGGQYIRGRHQSPKGFEADCEKYNLAALEGWVVLRFTTSMIHDGRAIATIADFLGVTI